jgi:hypothetical protein
LTISAPPSRVRWTIAVEAIGRDQLGDGDAGDGGVARQRDHGVAVAAEDEGGDVFDADVQLFGDEGAEAGGIEDAGHADDALAVEAGLLVGGLGHGVERIGDDDQDRLRRLRDDLGDHVGHDLVVGVQQVVAAHSGLARNAGGDDDDVGVGRGGVVVGADDVTSRFSMGMASSRSSALPWGMPSAMSMRTTSASSLAAIQCAAVAPTLPAPTILTFFRMMLLVEGFPSGG